MKNNTRTDAKNIETLFEEAGISFEIVERCPAPFCRACRPNDASRYREVESGRHREAA